MFRRFAFAFLGGLVAASCGGGSSTPTSPSATPTGTVSPSPAPSPTPAPAPSPAPSPSPTPTPTPTPSPSASRASFYVGFSDAGGYSAVVNGTTYSGAGPYLVSQAPGTYEVTGRITSRSSLFVVLFMNSFMQNGGVVAGSIRSLEGPAFLTQGCSVGYDTSSSSSPTFRVRYSVTLGNTNTC